MCMESKDPMGLPAGVVTGSGTTSTTAMHNGNLEASANVSAPAKPDAAVKTTHAPSIITPDTPNAAAPSPTAAPNSSHLSTPSPYMQPNMSTSIVPIPTTSGFGFSNPSPVFGFESMKKKRGRPRKYGPGGSLALSVTPILTLAPSPLSPSQKRGRGRPPGSGKNQQLAALGELMLGSIGAGFTPHAITVATGEDIASRIMSFSQQGPRGVCILSANGAISSVTLRQPSISGGIVTYEGRFEILSLSGSFLLTDFGGARSRTGGLSVSLAGPDGRVVGGGVAGVLIAASPVQVVVGSFMCNAKKLLPKPAVLLPKPVRTEGPTSLTKPVTLNATKPITLNAGDTEPNSSMEESPSKPVVAESPTLDRGAIGGCASSNAASPDGQVIPSPQSMSRPASQTTASAGKPLGNTDVSLPE